MHSVRVLGSPNVWILSLLGILKRLIRDFFKVLRADDIKLGTFRESVLASSQTSLLGNEFLHHFGFDDFDAFCIPSWLKERRVLKHVCQIYVEILIFEQGLYKDCFVNCNSFEKRLK